MASKYSDDEHDSDDEYDEDIGMWVGNPLKYGDYDNEGNYKETEEKEVKPLAAAESNRIPDSVKSESRREKLKRLMREKWIREREERKPVSVPVITVPLAPKVDADLAAARRGLPYAWEAHLSKTHGKVFYYNRQTGERVWEKPRANDVGKGGRKSTKKKRSRAKQPKRKRSMKRRRHATIRRK